MEAALCSLGLGPAALEELRIALRHETIGSALDMADVIAACIPPSRASEVPGLAHVLFAAYERPSKRQRVDNAAVGADEADADADVNTAADVNDSAESGVNADAHADAQAGAESAAATDADADADTDADADVDSTGPPLPSALDSLAWKREFKSDAERFEHDYLHVVRDRLLRLRQRQFGPEGFASTVWDSAIVLAKAIEAWAGRGWKPPDLCVELGAGCGLVGLALAALGSSRVGLTDLAENLPLLRENVEANADAFPTGCSVDVFELSWGCQPPPSLRPAALVIATDTLYSRDAVPALVSTLFGLCDASSEVLLAAGRNRQAADDFFGSVDAEWQVELVDRRLLDPQFCCADVDVWRMRLKP